MTVDPAHNEIAPDHVAEIAQAPLERLRALLLEDGGLMTSLVLNVADGGSSEARTWSAEGWPDQDPGPATRPVDRSIAGPAKVVACGPRAAGNKLEYELLVETIYEGYLLHYDTPRVVLARDADLGLLAGDRLYALGLARLVNLGDIEGVAELADIITLCALAHGGGQAELAAGIWMAGARAVGWGSSPSYERAKALVRAGSPDALEALRAIEG